ncbi:MAG: hypothetical protein M1812_005413 [Candelaria pacifica]|nr:MAG: hypothetical protein M1812_005413 [Candelaria pacifica]
MKMVRNFDNLITFLLGEIALCGEQGATLPDIFRYVGVFYGDLASDSYPSSDNLATGKSVNASGQLSSSVGAKGKNQLEVERGSTYTQNNVSVQKIDRPFKETIWKWLTAHPDVWVGKEKHGNKLSLSQMEAKSDEQESNGHARKDNDVVGDSSIQNSQATVAANGGTTPTPKSKAQKAKDKQPKPDSSARRLSSRVYISQDRMWYALTGHEVDWTKLPLSEFVLLSIIGASKEKGIVQTELTRISGQDKRSLPRRTDALHTKGYIEKKPALIKGQRTSHCTLRKYISQATDVATNFSETIGKNPAYATQEDRLRKCGFTGDVTDPLSPVLNPLIFAKTIIGYIKETGIITHLDLQRKLGVLGLKWHMRVCATTVRKLEIIGCVRRVKARSIYSQTEQATHRSVKFIREPEDHEWNLQWDSSQGIAANLRNEHDLDEDEDDGVNLDVDGLPRDPANSSSEPQTTLDVKELQETSRVLPQWTPDRPMSNQIFDLIEVAGTAGISTMDLKAYGLGTRYPRPLEHHLQRFTDCWQVSQPLHLRHLAIIRDTAQTQKNAHYNHVSYDNFQKKVDAGETSWEAVETNQNGKKKPKGWHAVGAEPELDEYGFVSIPADRFAGKDGDATLLESVLAANVRPHHLTTHDPVVFVKEDGSHELDFPPEKGRGQPSKSFPNDPRGRKPNAPREGGVPRKKLGRPRKTDEEKALSSRKNKPKNPKAKKLAAAAALRDQSAPFTPAQQDGTQTQRGTKRTADDAALDNASEEPAANAQSSLVTSTASGPAISSSKRARISGKKRQIDHEVESSNYGLPVTLEEAPASSVQATTDRDAIAVDSSAGLPRKRGRPVKKSQKIIENEVAATATRSNPRKKIGEASTLNIPGVYINPPGSAKPIVKKQGRPRKTMIAVFRSDRLKDVDWSKNPLLIPSSDRSATIASARVIPTPSQTAERGTTEDEVAQRLVVSLETPRAKPPRKRGRKEMSLNQNEAADDGSPLPHSATKGRKPPRKKRATGENTSSLLQSSQQYLPLPAPTALGDSVAEGENTETGNSMTLMAQRMTDGAAAQLTAGTTIEAASTSLVDEEPTLDYENEGSEVPISIDTIDEAGVDSMFASADEISVQPETVITRTYDDTLTNVIQDSLMDLNERAPSEDFFNATLAGAPAEEGLNDFVAHESFDTNGNLSFPENPLTNLGNAENDAGLDSTDTVFTGVENDRIDPGLLELKFDVIPLMDHYTEITKDVDPPSTNRVSMEQADSSGLAVEPQAPSNSTTNTDLPIQRNQVPDSEELIRQTSDLPEQLVEESGQDEVEEIDASAVTEPIPKPSSAKKPSGIYSGRGSLGFKKRQIILDIVKKCGGVFPGDKELWYPFTTAWVKPGNQSRPDPRTVAETKKALIDSGKLRRIVFCFKNGKGLMMKKYIITLPEIAPDSEAVQAMQENMIMKEPGYYLPPEVEISEEFRKELNVQNRNVLPILPIGVENEALVEIPHKLPTVAAIERKMLQEEKKRERERLKGEKAKQREKSRLKTLAHQQWDILHGLDSRTQKATSFRRSGGPRERPREDDELRLYDNETTPEPTRLAHGGPGRPRKRPRMDNELQRYEKVTTLDMLTGLEKPTQVPASVRDIHQQQRLTAFDCRRLDSLATPDRTFIREMSPVLRASPSNTTVSTTYSTPQYSPQLPPQIRPQSDFQSSFRLSSTETGEIDVDSQVLDVHRDEAPENSGWHNLGPASFDRGYNVQEYTTLVNPKQRLHASTGTFSTEFCVVGNARQDLWVQPNLQEMFENFLPNQLKDILDIPRPGCKTRHNRKANPAWSKFQWDVDIVAKWEMNEPRLLTSKTKRWRLINHEILDPHIQACRLIPPLQFNPKYMFDLNHPPDVNTDESTPEKQSPPRKRGRPPIDPLAARLPKPIRAPRAARQPKQPPSTPRKRRKPEPKTRRMTSLAEMAAAREKRAQKGNQLEINEDGGFSKFSKLDTDFGYSRTIGVVRHRRGRGSAAQYYMPQSVEQKLMTAVVVVRVLAGGINRNIDWVLVAELFKADYEQKFIQSAWSRIMQKNRLHIDKLEKDFQDIFIEAYENNVVPPIDYDNLVDYDWAWLVNWAQENLNMPNSKSLPELPGTREELEEIFELREEQTSATPWREAYFGDGWTMVKRAELITSFPNVIPLSPPREDKAEDPKFGIAKSWIKANVIGPEETYDSDKAYAKLRSLGESTIHSTIESLLASKVLARANKGRVVPGRNYDISKAFLENLKRTLDETHFRQATTLKASLDAEFRENGECNFSYHAKDGDVLAVMNLLTNGRIKLKPRNEPMKPMGLLDGTYKTRGMDKTKLLFDVILTPSSTYIYGNPLPPLPPAPMAPPKPNAHYEDTGENEKIPIWYDIHGGFVPDIWRMILACLLGTLALRPGTNVKDMTRYVSPSLESWEIEVVLEWLRELGVVRRRGEGWDVLEWWWLVVCDGVEGVAR